MKNCSTARAYIIITNITGGNNSGKKIFIISALKVNVNKSFNDLLGIRIILPDHFTHKELEQFMCATFPDLKLTVKDKDVSYKASHIYFMPKNKNMFPWELQVWYIGDEESNLLSHEQYKQGYTVWENEFMKGGV